MDVIIYSRVSPSDKAETGLSIDVQIDACVRYCQQKGWNVYVEISDRAATGKNLDRKGFSHCLRLIEEGKANCLMVYKLDRLSRSVIDINRLIEKFNDNDIHLISVQENLDTTTAVGRMFVNMLATFAQFERELISERTKDALAFRKKSGKVYGKTPYGYDRVGDRLIANNLEQARISCLQILREDSGSSYQRLANWMNRNEYPTKSGGVWHASSVREVLLREERDGKVDPTEVEDSTEEGEADTGTGV